MKNLKIKNLVSGITLIEIIVVIFVIALFSLIVISDYPEIQRQFALSNGAYKLAQDLRKTQDMALSGVQITGSVGTIIAVKGYGLYFDKSDPTKYLIYADVAFDSTGASDQMFNGETQMCDQANPSSYAGPAGTYYRDCIVEVVDLSKENPSLIIKSINDNFDEVNDINRVSVNFSPPGPVTAIAVDPVTGGGYGYTEVEIALGLTGSSSTRTVLVNTSGLINVQ